MLLGEGILLKVCRKAKKPRKFFLFHDILVYGSIILEKTKYTNQQIIPLIDVRIDNYPDDEIYQNAWILKAPKKSFVICANTPKEKEEWMSHIEAAIKELIKKGQRGNVAEHAAMMVPDSEATECMHCKKTKFTTFNRRHHCRKCGHVVCGGCSNYFVVIPGRRQGRERVCYTCYKDVTSNVSGSGNLDDSGEAAGIGDAAVSGMNSANFDSDQCDDSDTSDSEVDTD